jgi:hypothetical protein
VSKFQNSERRTTVEEKDANLEPDEKEKLQNLEPDVEGHVNTGVNLDREEDDDVEGHTVNTGVNLDRDEDDDVEGHVNYGVNTTVNLRQDEGDDVEGHVNI